MSRPDEPCQALIERVRELRPDIVGCVEPGIDLCIVSAVGDDQAIRCTSILCPIVITIGHITYNGPGPEDIGSRIEVIDFSDAGLIDLR